MLRLPCNSDIVKPARGGGGLSPNKGVSAQIRFGEGSGVSFKQVPAVLGWTSEGSRKARFRVDLVHARCKVRAGVSAQASDYYYYVFPQQLKAKGSQRR